MTNIRTPLINQSLLRETGGKGAPLNTAPTIDNFLFAQHDHSNGINGGALNFFPVGAIIGWPTATPPTGWLECNGAAVSRTTYSALFAIVSTVFGVGDGSTTFNVPDLKGRVFVGKGAHTDVSTIGNSDGLADASRTPNHTHTGPSHTHNQNSQGANSDHADASTGNVIRAATEFNSDMEPGSTTGAEANYRLRSGVQASGTGATGSGTPAYLVGGIWIIKATDDATSASQGGVPSHVLADNSALGPYHTISGATAGQVLVASSATAAKFASTGVTLTAPTLNSYVDFSEIAVPATAPANTLRIFAEDFKGFTFFSYIDSTGMVRKIVRDSVFVGKNVTGTSIPAMSPVYASGSSGNVPTLALAKADSATTMPSIGITVEAIADNAFGRVMQVGLLENVNTNAFTEGNVLYVSAATAGALTATIPVYPNIVQEVGTVLIKSVGAGAIQCIARSMVKDGYLGAGAAFPTSPTPVAGDRFFRTDLGWLCYYDGTRWLTNHTYLAHGDFSMRTMTANAADNWHKITRMSYAPYIVSISAVSYVSTANSGNNGSHYWTVTFNGANLAYSVRNNIHVFNTSADTVATSTDHSTTTMSVTNVPANYFYIGLRTATKTGTPGDLILDFTIEYRLIIT